MKPINKIPRLIRTATAVIVAGGLAVMVLSAQDDLDTVRQAAEQGDATAQFNLGNMYANGEGVPQDARCEAGVLVFGNGVGKTRRRQGRMLEGAVLPTGSMPVARARAV